MDDWRRGEDAAVWEAWKRAVAACETRWKPRFAKHSINVTIEPEAGRVVMRAWSRRAVAALAHLPEGDWAAALDVTADQFLRMLLAALKPEEKRL